MPNGSSRIKFFEIFFNFKFRIFLHVLEHFEHSPDTDFRKSRKIQIWEGVQSAIKHAKIYEIKNFKKSKKI